MHWLQLKIAWLCRVPEARGEAHGCPEASQLQVMKAPAGLPPTQGTQSRPSAPQPQVSLATPTLYPVFLCGSAVSHHCLWKGLIGSPENLGLFGLLLQYMCVQLLHC